MFVEADLLGKSDRFIWQVDVMVDPTGKKYHSWHTLGGPRYANLHGGFFGGRSANAVKAWDDSMHSARSDLVACFIGH